MLKESDDFDISGATFDSKMTFEKHLRKVSRAASPSLGILRKSWQVFHNGLLLGTCFRGLSWLFLNTFLHYGARLQIWCKPLRLLVAEHRITTRLFIPLSVSLWNNLADHVFDGVRLKIYILREVNAYIVSIIGTCKVG